jgi:hypothetical protein
MKKYFLILAVLAFSTGHARASSTASIVPVPTTTSTLSQPSDPNNFTFICTGDNRPPANGDPIMPICTEICHEIGLIHPDFVFWTGDTIYGYKDSADEANAEYDAFLSTLDICDVPVFNAVGNHEITDDPALTPIYVKRMGALYGSMDYGNSHFISLNTDPIVDGKVVEGTIDPSQLAWLQSDLEANKSAANIFVFMHHYVFGPPDPDLVNGPDTGFASTADRDVLHKIFVKYGVRAVFCGHEHIYWHANHDGVDYYISGNAGAPLDAVPEGGGYFGYMLVTVNGSTITTVERSANTLYSRTMSGDDGVSSTAVVAIDAPDHAKITTNGIEVLLPAGKSYSVTASATYKGKVKVVDASVLGSSPSSTPGVAAVRIGATLPGSRTTVFTVTAN